MTTDTEFAIAAVENFKIAAVENPAETMRRVMADLAKVEHMPQPMSGIFTDAQLAAIPAGKRIEDMTAQIREAHEFLRPVRRRGTARPVDLASLTAWANRFKGEESVLYANPDMKAPSLTCIADYHAEGAPDQGNPDGEATARRMGHRATYSFPVSDDWKAWMHVTQGGRDGGPVALDKDELGEFIEAQAMNIMDPTPAIIAGMESSKNADWENRLIATADRIEGRFGQLAQLLKMSKKFEVYETSDLKLVTNRDTGEREIQLLSEHKDATGEKLQVPNFLIIAIPVFDGGALYRMAVRFRYRKFGTGVVFMLQVFNPDKVFEAAFREAIDIAKTETALPLFLGTPES